MRFPVAPAFKIHDQRRGATGAHVHPTATELHVVPRILATEFEVTDETVQGTFDHLVVDGLVNFTASFLQFLGKRIRKFQTGHLQTYFGTMVSVMLVLFLVWTFFIV